MTVAVLRSSTSHLLELIINLEHLFLCILESVLDLEGDEPDRPTVGRRTDAVTHGTLDI